MTKPIGAIGRALTEMESREARETPCRTVPAE
jgi:hypothetical protein